MADGTKAIKVMIMTAAITSLFSVPAHSQASKRGSHAAPPPENHIKIDEKAYKAALDRIPTPKQGYDPWGVARPTEPAKNESAKPGK